MNPTKVQYTFLCTEKFHELDPVSLILHTTDPENEQTMLAETRINVYIV